MTIAQILILSTAHLPMPLRDHLHEHPMVPAEPLPGGYFGWCNGDDDVPEAYQAASMLANRVGCRFLLFDADAEPVQGLAVYTYRSATWDEPGPDGAIGHPPIPELYPGVLPVGWYIRTRGIGPGEDDNYFGPSSTASAALAALQHCVGAEMNPNDELIFIGGSK